MILKDKLDQYLKWLEDFIASHDPTRVLFFGYFSYMAIGFIFLSLPFSQKTPVSFIDNLFTSVSAVSTTGLITVDPSTVYSFFGQIILLTLIQLGGIGYMTLGSFVILQIGGKFSKDREGLTRTAFPLPEDLDIRLFLKSVVFYTLVVECIGATCLAYYFNLEQVESPIWSGIFHSISAFCTAGFSLNPDSFVGFKNHIPVNLIISILSILGAMGFIVVTDIVNRLLGNVKKISFTTLVIAKITFIFLLAGTLFLTFVEPEIAHLSLKDRLIASFFQTMTSTTTVGFNSIDIGKLGTPTVMLLFFFMFFGASPSGTGGGLKSTTFAALYGLVRSTLRRDKNITYMHRRVPLKALRFAASAFSFSIFILGSSVFLLSLTESFDLEKIVFESISALGTVGLSMGITGTLSWKGKLIIIFLMMIGRVGVMSFGLAITETSFDQVVDEDVELLI